MKYPALTLAALFIPSGAMAFSPLDPNTFENLTSLVGHSSTWENQSGSTMTITVEADGTVTGQYINRAKGTGCQNSPYSLVGRVNGDFIGFSVAWINGSENCNSVTSWTGEAQQNDAPNSPIQIKTVWNLAYSLGGQLKIQPGEDTFTLLRMKAGAFLGE